MFLRLTWLKSQIIRCAEIFACIYIHLYYYNYYYYHYHYHYYETVPIVIGAQKRAWERTWKIPGNINIEELQKASLLGTALILRKVLFTN